MTHKDKYFNLPSDSISYIFPLSHHILCISCLLFLIRFLYSEMRSFLPSTMHVLLGLGLSKEKQKFVIIIPYSIVLVCFETQYQVLSDVHGKSPPHLSRYVGAIDFGIFAFQNTICTLNLHIPCWSSFFSVHMRNIWRILQSSFLHFANNWVFTSFSLQSSQKPGLQENYYIWECWNLANGEARFDNQPIRNYQHQTSQ